jgi:hypothetical protein
MMHHTNRKRHRSSYKEYAMTMHPEDRPEAYEKLAPAEQAALLEWTRLAIKPAKTIAPNTSYGIKHDFESVGFYISNGQLKGAMLTAGYAPVDPDELNWEFRIRPTGKRSKSRNGAIYHVDHLTPEEREDLEALVRVAEKVRTRRYEENHRDNPHPANLSA